jgi:hypothetical protein
MTGWQLLALVLITLLISMATYLCRRKALSHDKGVPGCTTAGLVFVTWLFPAGGAWPVYAVTALAWALR